MTCDASASKRLSVFTNLRSVLRTQDRFSDWHRTPPEPAAPLAMHTLSLTLIGSNPAVFKDTLVTAVLDRWPENDRPSIVTTTPAQVLGDDSILKRSGVVWLLLDQVGTPELFELIGQLQDRHIPAMLTHPDQCQAVGTLFQEGVVAAPLNAGKEPLCAMLGTLWNQAAVIRSLESEVRMLQAHHGGLCDQIGKIDEELRLAAKLQQEFLPISLPDCGHAQFKVLYRPAGYVSGDIYDLIRLDDDHVGIFIADAAGHGVPAALMTMYIKRALHSIETDVTSPTGTRVVPPDEAMARLNNDMLRQQTGRVRFVTACYGVVNCQTMEISLARAGHPFPLWLHTDGTVTTLEPDGMLLGVFPDNAYELWHCRLQPGDRLLLYSDGFEMAFPQPDHQHSRDRCPANMQYTEEFKDLAVGPLDQAMARLEHKLDQQIGSLNQRDDLTVLCISAGDEATLRPPSTVKST